MILRILVHTTLIADMSAFLKINGGVQVDCMKQHLLPV